mgnify:CR=1 FL=1
MKFFPCLLIIPIIVCSCATPDPANLENTIEVQSEKMYEKVEKARLREEKWDRRWEDYSARQDAKYDAWIDGVFD